MTAPNAAKGEEEVVEEEEGRVEAMNATAVEAVVTGRAIAQAQAGAEAEVVMIEEEVVEGVVAVNATSAVSTVTLHVIVTAGEVVMEDTDHPVAAVAAAGAGVAALAELEAAALVELEATAQPPLAEIVAAAAAATGRIAQLPTQTAIRAQHALHLLPDHPLPKGLILCA